MNTNFTDGVLRQSDVTQNKVEYKVLICNNCKDFWISPKEKCDCGCSTLTETHQSNFHLAKNLKEEYRNTSKKEKTYNYKCSNCGSTYTGLKKPLSYSNCVIITSFCPDKVCNGKLKSTDDLY